MNEKELDAIRLRLYEETKRMTAPERLAYLRKLAAPVQQEFGISPAPVHKTPPQAQQAVQQ